MSSDVYDFVVIGGGAGGLTAARFAARLGARVALVERDRIGGDCTWTGCIPSKSLLRVAKAVAEIRTAQRFGVATGPCELRMPDVRQYLDDKIRQIYEPTTPDALAHDRIDVFTGPTAFVSADTLRVADQAVRGRRLLIATGATPVTPAITGLDRVPYFTYHSIFANDRLPTSLVVIGGGPLGMELAQAYRRLGSHVTIVAPRLLPRDDPAAADTMRRVFEREGIRLTTARARAVRLDNGEVVVTSDDAGEARGDSLLVSVGRRPNVHGLALERAGIVYSEQGIPVDDRLRTNVRHIYAAGDVLGGPQFSHIAGWQAFQAARNALLPGSASGKPNPLAWVTFTDPEVAQVGLTESQARARRGDDVLVACWPLTRIDRAVCDADEDGFIKIVTTQRGAIVGATIVAARAGELTGEIGLAIARGLTVGDLSTAIHAYPTYATALQQIASEMATANWMTSPIGRIVRRLMGFTTRMRVTDETADAETRR